jgi:hypothetical protein
MDAAAKGLGLCGICNRHIHEFIPTRTVTFKYGSYICHKTCAEKTEVQEEVKPEVKRTRTATKPKHD